MADTQSSIALNIGSQRVSMAVFEPSKSGGLVLKAYDSETILAYVTPLVKAYGVGSVLETLAAEEDLTRARLDYVGLVAEANAAQLELQRAIGADPEKQSGSDVIPRS